MNVIAQSFSRDLTMWVKFLKDLRYEGGRVLLAGSIRWIRRAGVITRAYSQSHSVMTLNIHETGVLLILPDDAEGDLYVQCEEPK